MRAAGGVALDLRGRATAEVKQEGPTDIVTEADRRAEALLLDLLREERPGDGVLGEEGSSVAAAGARRWVLDPVDGTHNYARGIRSGARRSAARRGGPCGMRGARRRARGALHGRAGRRGRAERRAAAGRRRRAAGQRQPGDVRRRPPARPRGERPERARRPAGRLAALPGLRLDRGSPTSPRGGSTPGCSRTPSRGTGTRARCSCARRAASPTRAAAGTSPPARRRSPRSSSRSRPAPRLRAKP